MQKIYYCFFGLLIINCAIAQIDYTTEYYPIIDSAAIAIESNDYVEAQRYYSLAFTYQKPILNHFYDSIKADYYADDIELVFKKLEVLVIRWGQDLEYLEKFVKNFLSYDLLVTQEWKLFETNYADYIIDFKRDHSIQDSSLMKRLSLMIENDQKFRAPGSMDLNNEQDLIDSINISELRDLVEANDGWFSVDQISSSLFIFIVALHIDRNDFDCAEYFHRIFQTAVVRGNLSRSLYDHYRSYIYEPARKRHISKRRLIDD